MKKSHSVRNVAPLRSWPKTAPFSVVLLASLLPLAPAHAQSNVTVYGVVDVSAVHGRGSLANNSQIYSGSGLGSRLGFRGQEDLGGGLKLKFVLESGLRVDTGTGIGSNSNNQASGASSGGGMTFNRQSWVGMSGSWGELRLGRDYTPTWRAQSSMDPGAIGTGLWSAQSALGSLMVMKQPGGVRASNSLGYYSPVFAGFSAHLMYALGENPSSAGANKDDGTVTGLRLSYKAGALNMVLAAQTIKMAAIDDIEQAVIGANYDFGPVRLWAQYVRDKTGNAEKSSGHSLSISAPVGAATELRAQWSHSKLESAAGASMGRVDKFALFARYNLSKRTGVYSTLAHVRNKDGASAVPYPGVAVTAPNTNSSAVEVGIHHRF